MNKLKGFRGLSVIAATWGLLFMDTFAANITGFSLEELKLALVVSVPITLKLIWTDLRPRLQSIAKGE